MTHVARICAALVFLAGCAAPSNFAQAAQHGKKPDPTQQELFDYVRGKLLALSATDGFNDNVEVAFDAPSSTLTITQPDGRCDIFLNAIDTSSASWEVFDPSDSYHTREDVLRLTFTSLNGMKARLCYDSRNQVDPTLVSNRVRFLFSAYKAKTVPNFTETMAKALKKLIVQSGGAPEKDLF